MYLISPEGTVRFDSDNIVLRARKTGGVYSSKMTDVLQAMLERSEAVDPPEIDIPDRGSDMTESKRDSEQALSTESEEEENLSILSSVPDRSTIRGNIKFKRAEAAKASRAQRSTPESGQVSTKSHSSSKKEKRHHDFSKASDIIRTNTPWTFARELGDYSGTGRHVRSESDESSGSSDEE
jgi:hypothetical protein